MPNFQNNFATNLTTGVSATDTTSPLNSIPTVDAPYYLAFDATNVNSHYEVVYVTSDNATNVNHAALTYDHTTAEEVRMVIPAVHLNTMQNSPRGHLINGKIVPSVASDDLTVAIKGLDGNDPSVTNPVYCRIGDTVRSITAALSVTKADGTNWFNSGSSELATKEVDYFVYLGYSATDGVVIGFSRIPYAREYSEFSATSTNEKYCAISTITNAAAGDDYENIGRFAATLSAGAGYTWTVPTFTNINLIQSPIYETRWLDFTSTLAGWAATPTQISNYRVLNNGLCQIEFAVTAGTSNATTATGTLPFINGDASNLVTIPYRVADNSSIVTTPGSLQIDNNANTFSLRKDMSTGAWTNANNKLIYQTAPWVYKI